jgi:signal transduction histidine kinase
MEVTGRVPTAAGEVPFSIEELVDLSPAGLALLGPDYEVLWHNRTLTAFLPGLESGMTIRDFPGSPLDEEKLDRLLFKKENIFIPADDRAGVEGDMMAVLNPGGRKPGGGHHLFYIWQSDLLNEDYGRQMSFLVGVSHELRSPLAAITGFAEVLGLDSANLTDTQAEAVEMIEVCARYLEDLVEDLLDLTLNAFGELKLSLQMVDLEQATDEMVRALLPRIEEKGQTVTCEFATDLPALEADPLRLRQIIDNLVRNAHLHCPREASITVSLRQNETHLCLSVEDDGPGIAFEDPAEAFRSFRRGGTEDPRQMGGAGIGLTLTARLVELHRGEIRLDTEPGRGTRFDVLLPIERGAARPDYEPSFP